VSHSRPMRAGQRVRLFGLNARPDMNGAHATVLAPASDAEAADLQEKGRIKVSAAPTGEVLSVRSSNATSRPIIEDEMLTEAIFSTDYFAVFEQPGRGYTWRALKRMSAGRVMWREEPLVVHSFAEHLTDPVVKALCSDFAPYLRSRDFPPEAMKMLEEGCDRMAEHMFVKLSAQQRRRYMSLADAFSTPPAKTAGNIYRTNSFARAADDETGGVMYEILSRINHSCSVSHHGLAPSCPPAHRREGASARAIDSRPSTAERVQRVRALCGRRIHTATRRAWRRALHQLPRDRRRDADGRGQATRDPQAQVQLPLHMRAVWSGTPGARADDLPSGRRRVGKRATGHAVS